MDLVRTEDEINDLLNEVEGKINEGGSRFVGMTYEQGIRETLMWAIGDSDDHPYPESYHNRPASASKRSGTVAREGRRE